jgi:hypothetical protein
MTSNPRAASKHDVIEPATAATIGGHVARARVALVLVGVLYAWAAYWNNYHLAPWRDGTMFADELTGELAWLVNFHHFLNVFTVSAGLVTVVLAAIAGKQTAFAIYTAVGIFVVYTALRIYQTDGQYLSTWRWWMTAIVLGMGFQAAYKANRLRRSQQLAVARLVA